MNTALRIATLRDYVVIALLVLAIVIGIILILGAVLLCIISMLCYVPVEVLLKQITSWDGSSNEKEDWTLVALSTALCGVIAVLLWIYVLPSYAVTSILLVYIYLLFCWVWSTVLLGSGFIRAMRAGPSRFRSTL